MNFDLIYKVKSNLRDSVVARLKEHSDAGTWPDVQSGSVDIEGRGYADGVLTMGVDIEPVEGFEGVHADLKFGVRYYPISLDEAGETIEWENGSFVFYAEEGTDFINWSKRDSDGNLVLMNQAFNTGDTTSVGFVNDVVEVSAETVNIDEYDHQAEEVRLTKYAPLYQNIFKAVVESAKAEDNVSGTGD